MVLGVRGQGSGVRGEGLGIRDWGLGIRDWGLGIRDEGRGVRGWRIGVRDEGLGVRDEGRGIRDWKKNAKLWRPFGRTFNCSRVKTVLFGRKDAQSVQKTTQNEQKSANSSHVACRPSLVFSW